MRHALAQLSDQLQEAARLQHELAAAGAQLTDVACDALTRAQLADRDCESLVHIVAEGHQILADTVPVGAAIERALDAVTALCDGQDLSGIDPTQVQDLHRMLSRDVHCLATARDVVALARRALRRVP